MFGLRSRNPFGATRTQARSQLKVEGLETRLVPYSVTGNAWPRPDLITIGFVPDATVVGQDNSGNIGSNLFSAFNARFGSASTWQKEILRAAATWAQQTNINFKVVGDNGADIGSSLYQQGDPNMADIRIGGYNFGTTTLSQAYLPAPLNNTDYAGDIQFNTGQTWNIGTTHDLYSVALHEFGHALGLGHGLSTSVMGQTYNGTVATLTADDISGIRAVVGYNLVSTDGYSSPGYGGARPQDSYDTAGANGTSGTASTITSTINATSKTALLQNLALATQADVDWYKFVVPTGMGGSLTVKVQSTGLSLLSPTLTVYNSSVSQLGTATATGQFGATVSSTVSVTAGQTYYVKVSAGDTSALGSGKYALTLAFAGVASPSVPLPSSTQTANGLLPSAGGGEPIALESEKAVTTPGNTSATLNNDDRVTNATAMATDGSHIIVWMIQGEDGSGLGIYGQLYNADGTLKKANWRINTTTTNDQVNPAVAMSPDGNFVVVWQSLGQDSDGWGVYGQRYNAMGVAQGSEFQVHQTVASHQNNPNVSMNASGNFVVSWTDGCYGDPTISTGVRFRTFSSSGIPLTNELSANTTTAGYQQQSNVGMDALGNFVVVWQSSDQDGSGWGVYGRKFTLAGNAMTLEFRINQTTANDQMKPTIAMASNGTFVVAWEGWSATTGSDVYARRYSSSASPVAGEFRVNSVTVDTQKHASVAIQPGGNFVVTWQSWSQDGTGWNVYSRLYLYNGLPLSFDLRINTTTTGDQMTPSIALNSNGGAVFVWEGYGAQTSNGIYKKVFQMYTGSALSNLESGQPHGYNPNSGSSMTHGVSHTHEDEHQHHEDQGQRRTNSRDLARRLNRRLNVGRSAVPSSTL